MSDAAWSPPATDFYPERRDPQYHWLDPFEHVVLRAPRLVQHAAGQLRLRTTLSRINALEGDIGLLTQAALQGRCRRVHDALRRSGLRKHLVVEAFALIREVSKRAVGLRHHDVQILGGLVMLGGAVAEMDTGEGKTLTATLAAATAAMANMPVHVITVNQYLAERDAATLSPIYGFLGLSVGALTSEMDPAGRRLTYMRDIVYASNKEIAFDYLRDRLVLGNRPQPLRMKLRRLDEASVEPIGVVMRGLHFAIVDEADSVLVDEARTPLIISRETRQEEEEKWTADAFAMVDGFQEGEHYHLRTEQRRIEMTEAGKKELATRAETMGGIWLNRIRREEGARQALSALRLFVRGEHYIVREGKVEIVDEYTGRVMPDRSWSDGLHQLVEAKEGCRITTRKLPMARMTYQRFFRRYLVLAGMSGTLREVRSELASVYRLAVRRIPPNVASRKTKLQSMVCDSAEAKWQQIVARVSQCHARGQPVLIGTRSIVTSQIVSARLTAAGLPHAVLDAEHSEDEAATIAVAGQVGRITVATNMAGRGVDIAVAAEALELGGLHVVLSERHDARRIDRQLEGRTARRGEPGTTETILSLEDPLLELVPRHLLRLLVDTRGPLRQLFRLALFGAAQRRAERAHAIERASLLSQDRRLGELLAFSGGPE